MTDIFRPDKRSLIMSKIRSGNTKPELIVRKFLFSQGFRFRLHYKTLPGRPDIVLPKYKAVIFVNGCFWHSHENCRDFKVPETHQEYWVPKLSKNKIKDLEAVDELHKAGWDVITIWECELKKSKIDSTLAMLISRLNK